MTAAAPKFRSHVARPDGTPARILVVDDEATLTELLSIALRYEGWEVVRDFGDLRTARAWYQALEEAGIEAALTADWPPDRYGHGEIFLCVPGDRWSEAEMHLSNLDVPDY